MIDKITDAFANIHRVVKTDEDLEWNRAVWRCTEIVQEVAKEYDAFDEIRKRVHKLELQYSESMDIENVKKCTALQNYLRYFKEQLKATYQKGE